MKTSQNGIDFIKSHEGLRLNAYQDIGGVWTIGYGHTLTAVQGMSITHDEAEQLLVNDLAVFEHSINTYLPDKLNQNQFDALVSLVYNVGSHAIFTRNYSNGFAMGSTLYNRILQGRFDEAAERFKDFVKVNGEVVQGLVNRRKKEKELFLTPVTFFFSTDVVIDGVSYCLTLKKN